MKKLSLYLVTLVFSFSAFCQQQPAQASTPNAAGEKLWASWTADLYDMGVQMTRDSLRINDEAKRILQDSLYRQALYPEQYSWEDTEILLKEMHLKKALWYLVNLYAADKNNKDLVLRSVLPFDAAFDMERALTSSFYTYAFLDPGCSTLAKGKLQILRPDKLEQKFTALREIVAYVQYFRKNPLPAR